MIVKVHFVLNVGPHRRASLRGIVEGFARVFAFCDNDRIDFVDGGALGVADRDGRLMIADALVCTWTARDSV